MLMQSAILIPIHWHSRSIVLPFDSLASIHLQCIWVRWGLDSRYLFSSASNISWEINRCIAHFDSNSDEISPLTIDLFSNGLLTPPATRLALLPTSRPVATNASSRYALNRLISCEYRNRAESVRIGASAWVIDLLIFQCYITNQLIGCTSWNRRSSWAVAGWREPFAAGWSWMGSWSLNLSSGVWSLISANWHWHTPRWVPPHRLLHPPPHPHLRPVHLSTNRFGRDERRDRRYDRGGRGRSWINIEVWDRYRWDQIILYALWYEHGETRNWWGWMSVSVLFLF